MGIDVEVQHNRKMNIKELSYWERVRKIFDQMDIRTAFVSKDKLDNCISIIENSKQNPDLVDVNQLHDAQKIRDAIVHPQTGRPILLPLRLSMVTPMNMVLDACMLSAATPFGIIGSQWLNQTYNALHYSANSNKTNEGLQDYRLPAYAFATIGSAFAALGMNAASKSASLAAHPSLRLLLGTFGPWAGVAVADVINLSTMRRNEYIHGIEVYDEYGNLKGISSRAGALAVGSCIVARVCAATPVLVIPPILVQQLEKRTTMFHGRHWLRVPSLLLAIGVMIQCAVPLCFGAFHEIASVPTDWLEEELHNNNPTEKLFYYKGL